MQNRVAELRQKAGYSQTELAKLAGVSRTTVWKMETDQPVSFTARTFVAVAHALGMSVPQVFFEEKVESFNHSEAGV